MDLVAKFCDLDETKRWNPTFQLINLETREINEDKTLIAARSSKNKSKNRYRDVLPYDDTRVKLTTSDEDYVNANYVQSSLIQDRKYILAQGPLAETCEDFWRMVWENNTTSIIMLNRIVEKNMVFTGQKLENGERQQNDLQGNVQIKCHPYWPMGENEVSEFGDFEIRNESSCMEDFYVVRDLMITNSKLSKTRNIKQYHFAMWPDFGVPNNPQAFLDFLNEIKRNGSLTNPDNPPIVHCSAGIGRSGTFILVDAILAMAERDGNINNIDVHKLLLSFRKCRCGLVQTVEQYRFANLAILHGLRILFPNLFKDTNFFTSDVEDDDGDPPPLPPRRTKNNVPPVKPERTTSSSNMKQQIICNEMLTESSDDESGEEEILDLSDEETFAALDEPESVEKTIITPDDVDLNMKKDTESVEIIPTGSKASANKDLRHRLREMKKKETQNLVDNIKRKMKDSEKESLFDLRHVLCAGAALGFCVGVYYVTQRWSLLS